MSAPRILVVEDDGLLALSIEDLLEDLGCEIAASLSSLPEVLAWLERGEAFDAAVIDVNLSGVFIYPAAEVLMARGVPFAFTTGYGHISDPRFAHAPVLGKPIGREQFAQTLRGFGLAV